MGGNTKAIEQDYGVDLAEFPLYFSAKSPQPMVAVEGKTHIVRYVNNAFEKLVGKNRSQLLGHLFEDAVPEGKENGCLPLLDRAFSTANPETLIEQEHSKFAPPVYWSYFVWPILGGPEQCPVGVMIQVTDVTEMATFKRRSMEANEALLISSVRQHELTEIVEQNAEELRLKTAELESIIGVVSHDLRAPLVNVKGFNNFIKEDIASVKKVLSSMDIPNEIRKQLDEVFDKSIPEASGFIESSANSMDILVRSLVEVAKVGLAEINPQSLDMNEILRVTAGNLEIKFKQADAHIQMDYLPPCWGDKVQVAGIFSNLIDNAVKYLDPGRRGKVQVSGEIKKDRVVYCVEDNGIGIAPQDQGKVFEIYTRLAEKSHAGGEGMGLTLVKRMLDRNNGQIWIESEKGRGSKFFVALPVAPKSNQSA
ncbi:MAG: hypothetical protein A2Y12_13475 [Planctomycetes bacterium GWF2_42_9]|nr:MAG: hypothetical protein A2Y12_13475 [Planctomycetes bacterium GWF2_42_9]